MKRVEILVEESLYEFYRKVGAQAGIVLCQLVEGLQLCIGILRSRDKLVLGLRHAGSFEGRENDVGPGYDRHPSPCQRTRPTPPRPRPARTEPAQTAGWWYGIRQIETSLLHQQIGASNTILGAAVAPKYVLSLLCF